MPSFLHFHLCNVEMFIMHVMQSNAYISSRNFVNSIIRVLTVVVLWDTCTIARREKNENRHVGRKWTNNYISAMMEAKEGIEWNCRWWRSFPSGEQTFWETNERWTEIKNISRGTRPVFWSPVAVPKSQQLLYIYIHIYINIYIDIHLYYAFMIIIPT